VALQRSANKSQLDNYLANHSQRQLDRHNSSVTRTQNVLQKTCAPILRRFYMHSLKCNCQTYQLNCSICVISMLNLYTCKKLILVLSCVIISMRILFGFTALGFITFLDSEAIVAAALYWLTLLPIHVYENLLF